LFFWYFFASLFLSSETLLLRLLPRMAFASLGENSSSLVRAAFLLWWLEKEQREGKLKDCRLSWQKRQVLKRRGRQATAYNQQRLSTTAAAAAACAAKEVAECIALSRYPPKNAPRRQGQGKWEN
jgi:hypothetical protein